MVKKKKKDQDFAKVKLKVGRKLKPSSSTNTEFKAKKVIIRAPQSLLSNPVHSLVTCATSSTSIKLLNLTKLSEGPILSSVQNITGEMLNAIARFWLDVELRVRKQARLCIERCFKCLEQHKQDLDNSISILLPHVKCALTHLNPAISGDARNVLNFLVGKSSSKLEHLFLQIVKSRIWDRKSISTADLELVSQIVCHFNNRSTGIKQHPVFEWSESNSHIPWCSVREPILSQSPDITFTITSSTSNDQDIDRIVRNLTRDGLIEFAKRSADQKLSLDIDQTRRLIAFLKLSRSLEDETTSSIHLPEFEISASSGNPKAVTGLRRQLKELVNPK